MSGTESTRRQQVLDVLKSAQAPVTLSEVADRLGVHPNTVRFHADRLLRDGQIEQVDVAPRGPGRPAAHFRAIRRMDPTGPRRYQALAEVLISALDTAPDRSERARAAGQSWGSRLAEQAPATDDDAADRLSALLGGLGFAPAHTGTGEIRLRHCPFLEVAHGGGDVVCPIHLGLMQGALAQWGADDDVQLHPFVEPDLCLARLDRSPTRQPTEDRWTP